MESIVMLSAPLTEFPDFTRAFLWLKFYAIGLWLKHRDSFGKEKLKKLNLFYIWWDTIQSISEQLSRFEPKLD